MCRLLVGHGAGAGGDQSPAAYKRGCVGLNSMLRDDRPCSDFATTCYDTSLSIQTRPLLPLRFRSTRVHATQASVCWRAQSTVDSLFFIDVPTNPGPRSFHAWAIRRCHWPVPQPIVRLLKPGPLNSTNQYPISPDPEYLGPRESISDNTLFHVSSPSSRHAPARD